MRVTCVVLLAAILAACALGFSLYPSTTTIPRRPIRPRSMSEQPSDSSSDNDSDYIIVDSEEYEPTPSESLVTSIMDLMPSTLGIASSETQAAINEALLRLESMNPTPDPALSPLVNGVWELKYVGGYAQEWALPSPTRDLALFLYSGGYSPGIFALNLAQKLPSSLITLGDLEITISRVQPRVEATLKVTTGGILGGGTPSKVQVVASLEAESGQRLRETYERASVLGREVEIPKQLQYQRQLYVTFVDEELLVVRDGSGVPEVLVRKDKKFKQNWGTEPSEVNDMVPPGQG